MKAPTKNIYTMKSIVYSAIFVFAVFVSSCSTSNTAKKNTDDVYYNPKEAAQEVYKEKSSNNTSSANQNPIENYSQQGSSSNGSIANDNSNQRNNQNNSNFESDDYYDYSYSSRIRRFHNPNAVVASGYYDPWYTNMYYFDNNPFNFGTSIYTTYPFYSPAYTTIIYTRPFGWGCSFGLGTRWGWNPYGGWNNGWYGYDPFYAWNNPWMWNSPFYNGWNNPYAWNNGWNNPYGWNNGWGFGGFNNGFNQGFAQGYWNGYNQGLMGSNYFNSYDRNSYFYGRRNNVSTSGRFDNSSGRVGQGIGDKYINAIATERDNVKNISTTNPILKEYISEKNDAIKQKNFDGGNNIKNPNSFETRDVKNTDNNTFDTKNPINKTNENVIDRSNKNFEYRANQPSNSPSRDTKNANFDTRSPADNKSGWDTRIPSNNNSFDTRVPENKSFERENEIRRNKDFGNSGSNERNFSSPSRDRNERQNNSFDTKPSRDNYFNDFKQGGRNRNYEPSNSPRMESPRQSSPRMESPRQSSPRMESPRQSAPSQRGGGRR
jgi:hypothetical protein